MSLRRTLTVSLITSFLVGCASQNVWMKSGATLTRQVFVLALMAFTLLVASVKSYAADADTFYHAVTFALTGQDTTGVKVLDRANCIFSISDEMLTQTFYLNDVDLDRLRMDHVVDKSGNDVGVIVNLHGESKVIERKLTGKIAQNQHGLFEIQPDDDGRRSEFNEDSLQFSTNEYDRVVRAWQYIYANGCKGKKSPF